VIARTLIVIGVLLCAIGLSAQAVDPYLRLLRIYRTDPSPATVSMARLSPDAINAGVRRCVPDDTSETPICRRGDLLAGAMLHLDAAEQVLAPNPEAALRHIRAGQRLLLGPAGLDGGHPTARDNLVFARRWYALAARLLLAHNHAVAASAIVTEGRTRYKEAPEFFVVMGVITEWRAGTAGIRFMASDLRGVAVNAGSLEGDRPSFENNFTGVTPQQRLETASVDYHRALALDPVHSGARLRLAWVHLLRGDARVWEDVSARFLETADPEARMIARLIRGTAAERERKPEVALGEYREARNAQPESQTACLAVSSAQALNGDVAGADATAAECLALDRDPDHVDSWTLFRLGLMDATTTRWLRDEARRP
jgi:hypothetical protein